MGASMQSLDALLAGLPDQFDSTVRGRVLILDADFPAYAAAATVKTLPTALRRFQTLVETERFVTGAEEVQVHLTHKRSNKCRRFDYPTAKPYQGNREGKVAPALLHPLRDAIPLQNWPDNWSVYLWMDREADDGMMMHSLLAGARGVVQSGDKDLRITPCPFWETELGQLSVLPDRFGAGTLRLVQLTQSQKLLGRGTLFFWAQMLMGDTADNVKGIKTLGGRLCGPAATYAALQSMQDESQAAQYVLDAYAAIKQDPLAEAQCLWLRRSNEDCAYRYLMELDLTAQMRAWLTALHSYHQEVLAIRAATRDEEKYDGEDQSSGCQGVEAQRDSDPAGIDVPW